MTKSTITRERLEQFADNNTICKVSWDERIELAQIALAAMDSESVAAVPEDVRQALSKMDDEIIAELDAEESASRAAMLHAGNSPAQSDCCPAQNQGWIPVSERMPEDRISVILWDAEIGEVTSGHYSHKTQTFYHCGDAIENEITHWMPPPCAPQEVK
ncbi:DUF551 domain-containing protein [Klebsiella pneumoniae]|uniref:DUF551 domain-containing protein n=1 Tax=Klebsiella pneumoniae TaxID=573 RepID=UPI0021192599|nr:DUF551 domain-containing protein [Klebsiella pneumoniae]MCQ8694779.1 DUF551 domain-containing protein [Klebsiella pneumoniae]